MTRLRCGKWHYLPCERSYNTCRTNDDDQTLKDSFIISQPFPNPPETKCSG